MSTPLSLEIVEGPRAGFLVSLTHPLEVGSETQSGLSLADPQAEPRHARVTPAAGGAVVEDLGSRNGTFVNGDEIHGPTRLQPGDQLHVGVTLILLRSAAQIDRIPSAVRPLPPGLAVRTREPDYVPPDLLQERHRQSSVNHLLDVHTKRKARLAPLALFVLVTLVVLIFLATR